MMQNIIVTRRWPQAVEKALLAQVEGLATIEFNQRNEPFNREQMRSALQTADVVCPTVTDQIDADLLQSHAVRTKLLANFGAGFNHIDLTVAEQVGVRVTNTPGVLTEATAEIALTLLLSVARRTGEGERLVRAEGWQGWHPTHMLSTQVGGKRLGIVGMGRIGLNLARKAQLGLGMRVLYHNRTALLPAECQGLDVEYVSFDELLLQSDFVSLHCPATPATRHLMDAQAFEHMRSSAYLINTARGEVVDERALVSALESGEIAGAGLDVYAREPVIDAGLMKLENVVLLPHMGSGTTETRLAMGYCAVANVLAFLRGEQLPNQVST